MTVCLKMKYVLAAFLLILLLFPPAGQAWAFGEQGPRVKLDFGFISLSDVEDADENISAQTMRARVDYSRFTLQYDRIGYFWHRVSELPFGNGRDDPWNDLTSIDFRVRHTGVVNDKWGYFVGGGIGSSQESGASGLLHLSASGGFSHALSPKTRLSLGALVRHNEVETLFFPMVGLSLGDSSRESSGFSANLGVPVTKIQYRFNPLVATRINLGLDKGLYKLADDNPAMADGYLGVEDWRAGWYLEANPLENLMFSVGLLYHFGREFTIYDQDGGNERDYSVSPSVGVVLQTEFKF